jgi:hypothetical protein
MSTISWCIQKIFEEKNISMCSSSLCSMEPGDKNMLEYMRLLTQDEWYHANKGKYICLAAGQVRKIVDKPRDLGNVLEKYTGQKYVCKIMREGN